MGRHLRRNRAGIPPTGTRNLRDGGDSCEGGGRLPVEPTVADGLGPRGAGGPRPGSAGRDHPSGPWREGGSDLCLPKSCADAAQAASWDLAESEGELMSWMVMARPAARPGRGSSRTRARLASDGRTPSKTSVASEGELMSWMVMARPAARPGRGSCRTGARLASDGRTPSKTSVATACSRSPMGPPAVFRSLAVACAMAARAARRCAGRARPAGPAAGRGSATARRSAGRTSHLPGWEPAARPAPLVRPHRRPGR